MTRPFTRPSSALALAAAMAAAGCASTGPAAAPPATAAPASWNAPLDALPHGGTHAALTTWWQQFGEPALPGLIDAAQAASPTLAVARSRIERARAAAVGADAAALPQLDAVGNASTGRSVPRAPTSTSATLGLQAAWEIDVMGGTAAGRQAARARLQGAQAGWHDARVAVAADTAALLVNLRACEAQLATARVDAASRDETSRLTQLTAQAGFTAPADAALARAGAAQSRSQALAQQAQCDTLVKSLVELTALTESQLRQQLAAGQGRVPQPAALAADVLPAQLLQQRPDVADAERSVLAAAAEQRQSRAREGLRISLNGNLGAMSLRTSGAGSVNGNVWTLGPLVVSFPLFDGGASAAATAAARAAYDEAVLLYQAQLRRALREVEAARVSLQSTAERGRDVEAAARDFEASLLATQARQRGGLASLLELENARRNAAQAQGVLIELQRERAAAWIALYRALGGGWTPAAAPVAAAR